MWYIGSERIASRLGGIVSNYTTGMLGSVGDVDLLEKRQVVDDEYSEATGIRMVYSGAVPVRLELPCNKAHEANAELGKQCDCYKDNICPEVLYYYHPDQVGSSTALTDANGLPYQFILYLPYGEVMAEEHVAANPANAPWATRYLFNGKEQDASTGMYYYGARYYDPRISVWHGVDPLAEEPEQVDKSPYAAFWNNPIKYNDPDGRCPNCITGLIGAGIGALIGGGVEIASQLYNNGSVNNWSAVGGSALQGEITGGAAGFTGGASLLTTAAVAGGANAVGGAANRATQGQGTTLTNIATDATVGAVLGAGGKLVGNAVSSGTNNLSNSAKGKLGEAVTEIEYGAQGYKSSGKAIVETGGKTATGRDAVAKYDHAMRNKITGKQITVESKFNGSTLTTNQAAAQSRVTTAGGLIIDRTTSQGLGNGSKAATVGAGSGVDAQRNKRP